jgi:hypothetical protein
MTNQEESHFVQVHTLANRFEADLLMGALEQEEIPAFLRSFEETPYDGLFVAQRGWGWIMVREDQAERARAIIRPLIDELAAKKLYGDPTQIDPLLWEKLRQAERSAICLNAQVRYDAERATYQVPFLSSTFACSPEQELIEDLGPSPYFKLNFELYLVLLHYLLESQSKPLAGKWASEKDIPGGELFFRGPHSFPVDPLIDLFGLRPELFRAAAKELGGTPLDLGDHSFRFWPFPRIPLAVVLWEGDDEFQPAINIRFDASINLQLRTLDTIWALVNVVCRTLRSAGKDLLSKAT